MKKFLTISIASTLALSMMMGCSPAATTDTTMGFDFNQSDSGFTPIFSDYPDQEGVEEFYEFQHSYSEVPIKNAGKGIFISGNNHSGDLFMGYVKELEGFSPGVSYHFTVNFKLATNVDAGLVGIGASPGEAVTVKCGIIPMKPETSVNESGHFLMNIDKGVQANSGKDMVVVGDMAKTENNRPGEYEFKELEAEFDVTANENGEVYLVIGTDSGFEATTSYYLDDITVDWYPNN